MTALLGSAPITFTAPFISLEVASRIGGGMYDKVGAKHPVSLGLAAVAVGLWLWASELSKLYPCPLVPPKEHSLPEGKRLYTVACATCHGKDGRCETPAARAHCISYRLPRCLGPRRYPLELGGDRLS